MCICCVCCGTVHFILCWFCVWRCCALDDGDVVVWVPCNCCVLWNCSLYAHQSPLFLCCSLVEGIVVGLHSHTHTHTHTKRQSLPCRDHCDHGRWTCGRGKKETATSFYLWSVLKKRKAHVHAVHIYVHTVLVNTLGSWRSSCIFSTLEAFSWVFRVFGGK